MKPWSSSSTSPIARCMAPVVNGVLAGAGATVAAMLLGALAGCAQSGQPVARDAADAPRVTVEFVEPERFVDARLRGGRGADDSVLDLLRAHLVEQARGCLPAGSSLTVRITDIDLAGETPPLLAATDFRVMRDITWPRIDLDWRLADADGTTLAARSESVSDMNYLRGAAVRADGAPLRYDRALLSGWLRRRFCP